MHRFARSRSAARYYCSLLTLLASACASDVGDPLPTFPGDSVNDPTMPAPGASGTSNGPGGTPGSSTDIPNDGVPLGMGGGQPPGNGTTTPPGQQPGQPPPGQPAPGGTLVRPTRGSSNLFTDVLAVPVGEVDQKVTTAVNRFFGIGTSEPTQPPAANNGYRVYYELPQDPSMAYIWAVDTNDIRSEGMSYGMMVAVQMDMQEQFDKLWKFARTFMQFPANSNLTAWRYYFRWQGTVNTSNAQNWQVNYGANTGPAPDGEEYFAAALYLANRRWGSDGGVNYLQDAQNLSRAMLNNASAGGRTAVINAGSNMVVFYPSGGTANYSDPSYHLPAFYELYALDGPQEDAARWRQVANVSRGFFVSSAHASTGLHPDYANFDGTPNAGGSNHNQFRFDAWRVVMNMAVDYNWFSSDSRLKTQVQKYHSFFASRIVDGNVANATFALDGSGASGGGSTALTATLASGALASDAGNRADFVENLWKVNQQSGLYRYYQESVYLLGLLTTAGLYGYEWAEPAAP
jgi:oligosaccharide reducing-end xylanase